jgi:2-iminobutanoate/2-iminopropanoate deaminase
MEYINNANGAPKPVGAYSQAVEVGGLVFLSGQIGIDPQTGQIVAGGVEEEARQVFKNLLAVLAASGSSPSQIVMSTVFLTDISHAKIINELYSKFVDAAHPPARQTVAVKGLPLGALIEISLIAAV